MQHTTEYADLERQILQRLDIAAESKLLGVRFTSSTPSASGWLSCHAVDREDRTPSAAVCIASDNGALGRYRDLGGDGKSCSYWELAVLAGRFSDWREARAHYAKVAGVELPGSDGQRKHIKSDNLESQFTVITVPKSKLQQFIDGKKPITIDAIIAAGCQVVRWPKSDEYGRQCLAIPFRNGKGDLVAVQLMRLDGQKFPAFKNLAARKIHTIRGSRNGWLVVGGAERLKAATVVWRVEGPSDAMTLCSMLPEDHVVVTSACGAGATHGLPFGMFKGKSILVISDTDTPGQEGAEKFAAKFRAVSDDVRIVPLPYEISENHGKDLRDFLNDGGTFSDLQRLADAAELVPESAAVKSSGRSIAEPHGPGDGPPAEEDDDPHRLARVVMDRATFRFWRGDVHRWNGRSYDRLERDEVRAMLTTIVKQEFDLRNAEKLKKWHPTEKHPDPPMPEKVSTGLISNVLQALESLTITPFKADWPRWIDDRSGVYIAVENGILRIPQEVTQ